MKLYFTPGACSLSPHIALRELALSFELEAVDLRTKKTQSGGDFLAINPKGYIPALILNDGSLLTEGAIIVQYLADLRPDARLAPAQGTFERVRLQEWLHFIATELHKGFGPINHPKANDELKSVWKERLASRFAILATAVEKSPFVLGEQFTVADGYAYYVLRNWRKLTGPDFAGSHALKRYYESIAGRSSVRAALSAEGIE